MTTPDEFRALIESPESTRVEWWARRPLTRPFNASQNRSEIFPRGRQHARFCRETPEMAER